MSRGPLDRAEVERALRAAKTKREFDCLVDAYRRPGATSPGDREALDVLSEELVQRFAPEGRRVRPGGTYRQFHDVLGERR